MRYGVISRAETTIAQLSGYQFVTERDGFFIVENANIEQVSADFPAMKFFNESKEAIKYIEENGNS